MKKHLYLVQNNKDNQLISNCLKLDNIFKSIKSRQYVVKNISIEESINRVWNPLTEVCLVVHSFQSWSEDNWNKLLENINTLLFVIPTDFESDEKLKQTFNHVKIFKIIVCTEYYQKYFNKQLGIDNAKIKLICLHSEIEYQPKSNLPNSKPIILASGMLSDEKDYELLLKVTKKLKLKYINFLMVLHLKSPINSNEENNNQLIENIYEKARNLSIAENLRIIYNSEKPYKLYLDIADAVLILNKNNTDLYSGVVIDAIRAHKAIIAPNTKFNFDLCKKEAGILLYYVNKEIKNKIIPLSKSEIIESILENCYVVLASTEIKEIMSEQNNQISDKYSFQKVSQQYINLVKRTKT